MNKLLLATLLLQYDFELTTNQSVRPQNMVFDVRVLPDMKKEISFKKRKKENHKNKVIENFTGARKETE